MNNCEWCGRPFETDLWTQKFCSRKHQVLAYNEKRRQEYAKTHWPSIVPDAKYIERLESGKGEEKKAYSVDPVNCPSCGKFMAWDGYDQEYTCSCNARE